MTRTDTAAPRGRIGAIDALRGLVMLLMLVDHVREFFYLHAQVTDPMTLSATPPGLAWTRLASHVCAPVFILLAGLSANLYAQRNGRPAAAGFLLARGLLLVALEATLVNLAWTLSPFPPVLYLQVIWAIGLSMIALAGLLWLPRVALAAAAAAVVLGHNLLDGLVLVPGEGGFVPWAILHQRGLIALPWPWEAARTSYPVLPWIGVAAAGYVVGPLFAPAVDPRVRRRRLVGLGLGAVAAFLVLRGLNGYGEPVPWQPGATPLASALSVLNLTKYPPSAGFLLATLGLGLLLLALFEALPAGGPGWLRVFGGAPLFFYLLHLWLLRLLYEGGLAFDLAASGSGRVEAPSPAALWLIAALLALPLYAACAWMTGLKRRSRSRILRFL